MRINSLKLNNFRNYSALELSPCEGITVFWGDNAQGKTNLLESLYLCCTGRSHRTHSDRELIKWNEDVCRVSVIAERRDGTHTVDISIPVSARRVIKVNGSPIARSGELMGHVTGVLFSPEDLRTVKDGPAERRRFIDMALSQLYPAYYYCLQRYLRALKQRNEALRTMSATLESWDMQLATYGSELVRYRSAYISRLSEAAKRVHSDISIEKEALEIRYQPSIAGDTHDDVIRALIASRASDMRRMTTTVGAHRDDIALFIDDMDVRAFGSQGQQRTAALSMRLGELAVMEEISGERPVLLLDDVMSELDPFRRRALLSHIEGIQVLVTCTDINDLAGADIGMAYNVISGVIG